MHEQEFNTMSKSVVVIKFNNTKSIYLSLDTLHAVPSCCLSILMSLSFMSSVLYVILSEQMKCHYLTIRTFSILNTAESTVESFH